MKPAHFLAALAATAHASPTSCGQTPVQPNLSAERIVGGQTAVPYSWPWQVVLCTSGWFGGCSLECGGSVIDKRWVMTAARCVNFDMHPKNYQIKAAVFQQNATVESGEQISKVKSIYVHPKYDVKSRSNNIALLELPTPFQYSDHLQPICLPANDSAATAKPNSAYVTGWGNGFGAPSIELRQVKVPFVDYETCKEKLYDAIFDDIMVCAGSEGIDTWMLEAGAPLVVQGASGTWFQVGISSFEIMQFDTDEVEVYSRVSPYCDFISSTTSGKASCQPIA